MHRSIILYKGPHWWGVCLKADKWVVDRLTTSYNTFKQRVLSQTQRNAHAKLTKGDEVSRLEGGGGGGLTL